MPGGTSDDGLPIGMQLVGRHGEEATLLSLAAQLEGELRWTDHRPPPPLSSLPRVRQLRIQDTLSGDVVPVEPRDASRIGIYACGPTVYGRIHVGNARPYVVFSLLKRFLEHEGYDTSLVINITDVNDKIYDAARERGVPSAELAREMTAAYVEDTDRLGLGRPDAEPKATETIGEIVALIEALVESDHAYERGGDVYFRVPSLPGYGKLSNRPLEEMQQGEGDDAAELKESPQDFALWKGRKEGEDTCWESPWGDGRPGWHIECSAMAEDGARHPVRGARRRLGPRLSAPRERDRADRGGARQAAGAHVDAQRHGRDERREDGEVGRQHPASARRARAVRRDAFLMWMVGAHYRKPVAYSEEALEEAARAVERVRDAGAPAGSRRGRGRMTTSRPSSTPWLTTSTLRRHVLRSSTGSQT